LASYDTSMIWLYLMEHNASDTSTSSPGVDFIRRFLEKTHGPTFPPNEARLVNKLNELLADEGTTLDSEMKRFAYANLVRSFDNLDEYHPYGYSWDDSYMTTSTSPYSWTWNDIERASGASSRVLSLDTPGGPIELPDHVVPATFNSIDVEYGAEYWELDVDL
jgi:hypothetical protein